MYQWKNFENRSIYGEDMFGDRLTHGIVSLIVILVSCCMLPLTTRDRMVHGLDMHHVMLYLCCVTLCCSSVSSRKLTILPALVGRFNRHICFVQGNCPSDETAAPKCHVPSEKKCAKCICFAHSIAALLVGMIVRRTFFVVLHDTRLSVVTSHA